MADNTNATISSNGQGSPQSGPGAAAQSQVKAEPAVIDLRAMDTKMPGPPAPAAVAGTNAAAQPVQPAKPTSPQLVPTSGGAKAPTPGAINLEEAAMLGAQTTVAPPQEKYNVPDIVKQKFPDLIDLVKATESMNDEERDYWFQILPIMTEDQIKKFYDILVNEKKQLAHLDTQYEQELNRLNQKHLLEWKEFESKEKRKALKEAESRNEQEEKAAEEDLLKRLSQV